MMIDFPHVRQRGDNYQYRRRVPAPLQQALGKKEIIVGLGKRDRGFSARYQKTHTHVETILRPSAARADDVLTPRELGLWAEEEIERRGLDPDYSGHQGGPEDDDPEDINRSVIADGIIGKYPMDDEGQPVGVTDRDAALLKVLFNGKRQEREDPTLEDAKRLYLKEKVFGSPDQRAKVQRADRVIGHVHAALRRKNPTLSSLKKIDAFAVRDHIQATVNTPATARRYLNDLRAIITFGIDVFGLRLTVDNPFHKVTVKADNEVAAKDKRHSFTQDQLERTRARVMSSASTDLQHIWRLLEGTGCRLSEVAGLKTDDVVLDHPEHPYLDLRFHPHRSLKSKNSIRRVPLVGDTLKAAREAKAAAGSSPFLFDRYHDRNKRGADRASAALMKHVRACVTDRKVVVHSLRHNTQDALLVAEVPEDVRDLISGRAAQKVSAQYGSDDARLEVTAKAMRKAFGVK